jgi:site-specific DNA-methyltransferase (cytosine-N4-specific)
VRVFREVRRLLIDGGTCLIVIGDTSNNVSPVRARHQRKSVNKDWLFRRKLQAGYREKEILSVPHRLAEAFRQDGWVHRNTLIWDKGRSSAMANSDTAPIFHEYILHLINWPRHGRPYGNTGPLRSSILRHPAASHPKHGCVFPVSLVKELLSAFDNGLTVIDPYIGSGTVAVAALPFEHRVYGFDLDCSIAMAECTKAGTMPALSMAPESLRRRAA